MLLEYVNSYETTSHLSAELIEGYMPKVASHNELPKPAQQTLKTSSIFELIDRVTSLLITMLLKC